LSVSYTPVLLGVRLALLLCSVDIAFTVWSRSVQCR